ncbi:inhibitor of trypsin and hageman factor [Salix suchowensis]|nr:inhibitor of trypsin and hageman factor [Salix suchowensis]
MASECQGKSSWPELLGAQARVAVVTIETQNPNVDTQVVLEGTIVTGEFSCTRVRVWIDRNRVVTRVPMIG